MQKTELKELMDYISAIDNREVTQDKMRAWYDILGYLPFDVAKESVVLAQRDPAIKYVEPRHIIAFAARVKDSRLADERRQQAGVEKPTHTFSRMPKCKHGIGLLTCDPCCRDAAKSAGLIN